MTTLKIGPDQVQQVKQERALAASAGLREEREALSLQIEAIRLEAKSKVAPLLEKADALSAEITRVEKAARKQVAIEMEE